MDNKTEWVHADDVKHGDTIIFNGEWKTVSRKFIKKCPFMGTTIYGQPFIESNRTVERVLFPYWLKGRVIAWHAQI